MSALDVFGEIYLIDCEYRWNDALQPDLVCLVAKEVRSQAIWRYWNDELKVMHVPPFPVGGDVLFVAYSAQAEWRCFLELGWPLPARVLDLFAEFRVATNGVVPPGQRRKKVGAGGSRSEEGNVGPGGSETMAGYGLLAALQFFGLGSISKEWKDQCRELVLKGSPWSDEEKKIILDYCESDVVALEALLVAMNLRQEKLGQTLIRGQYSKAVAAIERRGVPIDLEIWEELDGRREEVSTCLIAEIDKDYGVFENGSLSYTRFERFVERSGLDWPTTELGRYRYDKETLKELARRWPWLKPLADLLRMISHLRPKGLRVSIDGVNRADVMPYQSKTGRNQPRSREYIFGWSSAVRGLVRPGPGRAIAYIDYDQQEFGVAAALSGDLKMQEAYRSGDPYLATAKACKAVPEWATKESHRVERDRYKVVSLGMLYGMEAYRLSNNLGLSIKEAESLIALHKRAYGRFWEWSDATVYHASMYSEIKTALGWKLQVVGEINPRSIRNFPMQGTGAEILRVLCCLLEARGAGACALVHDAVLIEGASRNIDAMAGIARGAMADASRFVLGGFELRTEAQVVHFPERLICEKGRDTWGKLMAVLGRDSDGRKVGDGF